MIRRGLPPLLLMTLLLSACAGTPGAIEPTNTPVPNDSRPPARSDVLAVGVSGPTTWVLSSTGVSRSTDLGSTWRDVTPPATVPAAILATGFTSESGLLVVPGADSSSITVE